MLKSLLVCTNKTAKIDNQYCHADGHLGLGQISARHGGPLQDPFSGGLSAVDAGSIALCTNGLFRDELVLPSTIKGLLFATEG